MSKELFWTDTHAHLEFFGSDGHVEEIVDRAFENGVKRIITIGDSLESSQHGVKVSERYDHVYAAVGIHPHEGRLVNPEVIAELRELAQSPKVVAIGEIGLDYYRDHCTPSEQRNAFTEQVKLAKELDLPIIIHDREADFDVFEILDNESFPLSKALLHCFSGSAETATLALERGFHLSFSGTVTFGKSTELKDVAMEAPLDRIMIETDSPFLAPEPYRGRTNEPSLLPAVGECIAEARGMTPEEFSVATSNSASAFFGLPAVN